MDAALPIVSNTNENRNNSADTSATDSTFLNDVWTMYFHNPDDENWTFQSYHRVGDVSTVEDFVAMYKGLQALWNKGMFFLMREHIQPLWEDKHNRDGGCLSFKLYPNEVENIWFSCCATILGERLCKDSSIWSKVCGISIAPKRGYCLARIWLGDTTVDSQSLDLPISHCTKTIFKSHKHV